jgi:ribose 5-phosphate isomerase B
VKIVLGTDEDRPVVEHLARVLADKGHEVSRVPTGASAEMAQRVAKVVSACDASMGIVRCWTGTGVSIAANRVPGIRAALCVDAATAEGARKWNDANVLALRLRLLSEPVATEILSAWLDSTYAGTEDESLGRLL